MAEVTVATVLYSKRWSPPGRPPCDYTAQHAQWLHKQISQHWNGPAICLSDVDVPGVKTIPLIHHWPGWWSKMELMRPDIAGDILYLDLDTVVTGDLTMLASINTFTMLQDFYKKERFGSGLMYLPQSTRENIWARWCQQPVKWMQHYSVPGVRWGDQGFIQNEIEEKPQAWQTRLPGKVLSYKVHCKSRAPDVDARVVCFHGHPRPWEVQRSWIPDV